MVASPAQARITVPVHAGGGAPTELRLAGSELRVAGSEMRSTIRGDLLLRDSSAIGSPGDISLGDDANTAPRIINDGNAAHLPISHRALDVAYIIVGRAAGRERSHDLIGVVWRTARGISCHDVARFHGFLL
jgi:hypothetical protein